MFFFFKQKTAYEMRISDWSSDVCSSDLEAEAEQPGDREPALRRGLPPPRHRQHREAVGDRREQQHRGVERDQRQLEQLARAGAAGIAGAEHRSEEHTSELQSLMRSSYAVFCLKQKTQQTEKEMSKKSNTAANNREHTH